MDTHRFGMKIKLPSTIAIKHQLRKMMFDDLVKQAENAEKAEKAEKALTHFMTTIHRSLDTPAAMPNPELMDYQIRDEVRKAEETTIIKRDHDRDRESCESDTISQNKCHLT